MIIELGKDKQERALIRALQYKKHPFLTNLNMLTVINTFFYNFEKKPFNIICHVNEDTIYFTDTYFDFNFSVTFDNMGISVTYTDGPRIKYKIYYLGDACIDALIEMGNELYITLDKSMVL